MPDVAGLGQVACTETAAIGSVTSAAQASQLVGFPVLMPHELPGSLASSSPTLAVLQEGTLTYTFRREGLPTPVAGTTLTLAVPPVFLALYGGATIDALAHGQASPAGLPLVLAESRVPTVTSTGATLPEIENALLSRPGVSPALRAQLSAIGNPASTLPIPVPAQGVTSSSVTVQGEPGLLLTHGARSLLLWRKGGEIYALAGSEPPAVLLSIAGTLTP